MKFKLHIHQTIEQLLTQEDTDGDNKITIEDQGPKRFLIKDESGINLLIEGTYYLSNLLQELALAAKNNSEIAIIDSQTILEAPVARISRKIKDLYWDGLSRTIDEKGILKIIQDEKIKSDFAYLYISANDPYAFDYFKTLEKSIPKLKVIQLKEDISDEYSLTLNKQPGLLALALQNENNKITGIPFVVPGGRFNEMYGWDSYFISMGLLADDKVSLAVAIAENFKYQIDNYGKILNANRSYYLTRSQPPFYSSLIVAILKKSEQQKFWIEEHLKTIIKEYQTVWMVEGKRLSSNGLNRYKAEGIGLPFEVEEGHFDDVLEKHAQKHHLPIRDFEKKYLNREITDDVLDLYFIHDRSMRESGHDTTNRLINICADLNSVDINCLLYKYETDIAFLIETKFNNSFAYDKSITYGKEFWHEKAAKRKIKINEYCWSESEGMYFDYNFVERKKHLFEAATTFYPLWAGVCDEHQAEILVKHTLAKFKMKGGIAGSTQSTIANLEPDSPQRQWDYPFGWAPHQIILWKGLLNYGYDDEAQEMIYRWLWLITRNAVDYNGTIPEKFDLELSSHKIFAEYGNVGVDFDYITEEGFGWVNASYQVGLSFLRPDLIQELNKITDPELLFG